MMKVKKKFVAPVTITANKMDEEAMHCTVALPRLV